MGTESWTTKADIMKDLYQVSGRTGDVDEEFIIQGQKPPPPRRVDDNDDEIANRFGCQTDQSSSSFEMGEQSPDLKGITDMLRMIDDYDDVESVTEESKRSPIADIVYISKLDPSVPDFVPRSGDESSPSSSRDNNTSNENNNSDNKASSDETKPAISMDKRIDVSKLKHDEIIDISKILRSKISDSSKNNLHSKRERNVAIATLLKLYSVASAPPVAPEAEISETTVDKPIKLLSPHYFESSINRPQGEQEAVKTELSEKDIQIDNPPVSDGVVPSQPQNIFAEAENLPLPAKTPVGDNHYEDTQVRESIKKVNSWLQNPKASKHKGPVLSLAPFEYKSKSNIRSPNSSDVESKRSTPTKKVISNYRPSQYAQDLSNKFKERSKTREMIQQDMWCKVKKQMKEKEDRMKQQQEKNSTGESTGRDDGVTDDPDSSV